MYICDLMAERPEERALRLKLRRKAIANRVVDTILFACIVFGLWAIYRITPTQSNAINDLEEEDAARQEAGR